MASVLTPYKPSDGNSPYTEAQLKVLWADLEPEARAPGKYSIPERVLLQREFLKYIAEGWTPTRACDRLKSLALQDPSKWPMADYGVFMAWKHYDKDFATAWEVAFSMGTDKLEDKGLDLAMGGNASMVQFLLKMRNPNRYNKPAVVETTGEISHVHTIKLIGVKAEPLEIEHEGDSAPAMTIREYEDAEIVE